MTACGGLVQELTFVSTLRSAERQFKYELANTHSRLEKNWSRSMIDDLKSNLALETGMYSRCSEMHANTEAREGAFSFDPRGETCVGRNVYVFGSPT